MWWTLYGLWPNNKRRVTWMAMIFAVYPVFFQQPVSVVYSQVFILYIIFFLSIGSMIWAYRMPKYYWPFIILSWITAPLHLFTIEYFFGLELCRPLVLWFLLNEEKQSVHVRWKALIKKWMPFLLILVVYLVWRFYLLQLPGGGVNSPVLLADLLASPFSTLSSLLETIFQEVTYLIVYVWTLPLDPETITLSQPFVLFSWIMVFAVIFGLSLFMKKATIFGSKTETNELITKQGIIIGIFGIFVGFAPVWIAGKNLIGKHWTDRFSLAPMFGASILVISLLIALVHKNSHRIIVVSMLVGLAIGAHLRNENIYRWEWVEQEQFFWQLYWRAPRIKPNTAIFNEDALFSHVSKYSASTALNTLYPTDSDQYATPPYWIFELQDEFPYSIDNFIEGERLESGGRHYRFVSNSRDSLVLYFEPHENPGACLWVLSSADEKNLDLPSRTRQVIAYANFDRIDASEAYDWKPDQSIFGQEPAHTWCYYFQKAALAKQLADWEKVTELFEEAKELGYRSSNPYEDFPFVEGYAYQGDWDKAQEITKDAYKRHATVKEKREFAGMVCYVWNSIENNTSATDERDVVLEEIYQMVNCK
jgi:hypothetical protein